MNQQNPLGSLAGLRGAVDLSALKARAQAPQPQADPLDSGAAAAPAGAPGDPAPQGAPGGYRAEVTEANFQDVAQISLQVPVILGLWASYSPASSEVLSMVERLVNAQDGRMLLGAINVETFPQIMQALQIQGVPAAVAIIKGQPVPLFQGPIEEAQLAPLFAEVLQVAAENGVSGQLGAGPAEGAPADAEEPPLPPLHQEALDAINVADFDRAIAAYTRALEEKPSDHEAKAGLAQVRLMQRLDGLSHVAAEELRAQAAGDADDLEAHLSLADLDVAGGHVDDAFNRIINYIGTHFGPEREPARVRLLDLFEVVGTADPRVAQARQKLARVLF